MLVQRKAFTAGGLLAFKNHIDFDCETPQRKTSLAKFLLLARRGESIVVHVSCWGG